MICFYVKDAKEIASGHNTAIVTAVKHKSLSGPRFLIVKDGKDSYCAGVVVFADPLNIDAKTFSETKNEHLIERKNRLQWWPTHTEFFLYRIKQYYPLVTPQPVTLEPGTNMHLSIPLNAQIIDKKSLDGGFLYTLGLAVKGNDAHDPN